MEAELVEAGDRSAAVDATTDLDGALRLPEGLGQRAEVAGDAADAGRERDPAAAAVTAYGLGDAVDGRVAGGGAGVGVDRHEGDDLLAEGDRRDALVDGGGHLPPGVGEAVLPGPPLLGPGGQGGDRVGVEHRDHHHHGSVELPPEGLRVLGDVGLLAGPAEEHVAQEVAAVLVLHRRDRLLARHQQRGHDRRALERLRVGGVDRAVGSQRHEPRQVDTGRHHAAYERLALAHGGAVGIDPLDPEPTARVEQGGVRERRALGVVEVGRPLAAVGRGEDDPAAERVTHGLGDRGEVAALEHDVGERGVQRVGTVQRGDRLRVAYQVLAHFCPLLQQDVTFASVATGR